MLSLGWDKKPGVRVVHGRWQDVIDQVSLTRGAWWHLCVGGPMMACEKGGGRGASIASHVPHP